MCNFSDLEVPLTHPKSEKPIEGSQSPCVGFFLGHEGLDTLRILISLLLLTGGCSSVPPHKLKTDFINVADCVHEQLPESVLNIRHMSKQAFVVWRGFRVEIHQEDLGVKTGIVYHRKSTGENQVLKAVNECVESGGGVST